MSTFENPLSVSQTAREYLIQQQKVQQKNFAANTGAAPLIIPLRVKEEYRVQFCRHPRFAQTDLVDLYYLARLYLKGAKSFPLTDRETCIAILLTALSHGAMPVLPRTKALQQEDGRRFRP